LIGGGAAILASFKKVTKGGIIRGKKMDFIEKPHQKGSARSKRRQSCPAVIVRPEKGLPRPLPRKAKSSKTGTWKSLNKRQNVDLQQKYAKTCFEGRNYQNVGFNKVGLEGQGATWSKQKEHQTQVE